jgi:hypothetical protein
MPDMKFFRSCFVFSFALLSLACEQKSTETLYNEVMAVHDEVMPKMNELYKTKTALSKQLNNPGLSENQKREIEVKIARIDTASEGMMVWMRQFQPLADTIDEGKAQAYLKNELARVKKVREDILQALQNTQ